MSKRDFSYIIDRLLLRRREKSAEEKLHGTFNRRMIAASLDSLLIAGIIAPLVDYLYVQNYGAPSVSFNEIAARVSQQAADGGAAAQAFLEELQEAGYWNRMVVSTKWQYYAYCAYSVICWHFWSATPGKMLCRLQVVDAKTGAAIGLWQGILRAMCYFISAFPFGLGFFWIGFNKKRRGWHDLIAGTMVVIKEKAENADETSTSH